MAGMGRLGLRRRASWTPTRTATLDRARPRLRAGVADADRRHVGEPHLQHVSSTNGCSSASVAGHHPRPRTSSGFFYSLSDDLIDLVAPQADPRGRADLVLRVRRSNPVELPVGARPAQSASRNFETSGRTPTSTSRAALHQLPAEPQPRPRAGPDPVLQVSGDRLRIVAERHDRRRPAPRRRDLGGAPVPARASATSVTR